MGTHDLPGSLLRFGVVSAGWAVLLGGAFLLARVVPRRRELLAAALAFFGALAILAAGWRSLPWLEIARPLPAALALLVVVYARDLRIAMREPELSPEARRSASLRLALALFALALLPKMLLNARLHHYGFVLAMPGTLVVADTLLWWVPGKLSANGLSGRVFRAVSLAALAAVAASHVLLSAAVYGARDVPVGSHRDLFLADARGTIVNEALEQLRRLPPGDTLLALPEGVMLNYLSRRENPTPYTNFMPVEVSGFVEETMLGAFEAHPPDVIALVHKDTSGFGFRFFGRDYAQRLFRWVQEEYVPIALAGRPPLVSRDFGVMLFGRRGAAPPESPPPPVRDNPPR